MFSPATAFAVPLGAVETLRSDSDARGHSSGYREAERGPLSFANMRSPIVLGTFGQHLGLSAQASQSCLREK